MKAKTIYVCQECGATSVKWYGKCPSCGAWNSYVEETPEPIAKTLSVNGDNVPLPMNQVDLTKVERMVVGMPELDGV